MKNARLASCGRRHRRAVFLAILILVVATGVPSLADDETTEVREPSFKLSLPGTWKAVPPAEVGLWQYRQEKTDAQVSVSVAFPEPPVPRDEISRFFDDFVASRRRAVVAQSPKCELSASEKREHLDAISGTALGACGPAGPRIGDQVIVRSDLVASFLLEASDLSEQDFRALFQSIVSGSGLARPRDPVRGE
ncbi:MAG: hypothetical protein JRH01_02515 [Deltaproteobacteria bacterium]|nr:hypothetical protein [Deltaproteobacteria bacterium]